MLKPCIWDNNGVLREALVVAIVLEDEEGVALYRVVCGDDSDLATPEQLAF